jgi:prepilin-type processing-associated H-X9-DG protein
MDMRLTTRTLIFPSHNDGARSGFGLVELIVVTGIIGMLIAILLPMLARARRSANELKCAAQVRQLTIAFTARAQDKPTLSVPRYGLDVAEWYAGLARYVSSSRSQVNVTDEGEVIRTLLECPETESDGQKDEGVGTARAQWRPPNYGGKFRGSYGVNGWLESGAHAASNREKYFSKWGSIKHPTEVPVFADAIWLVGWPLEDDTPATNLREGQYTPARNFMARFCIDRHRKAINVGFCDGSVRRVPLADLWRLKWHRTWQSRDVHVP